MVGEKNSSSFCLLTRYRGIRTRRTCQTYRTRYIITHTIAWRTIAISFQSRYDRCIKIKGSTEASKYQASP